MKASELIEKLQDCIKVYGDRNVETMLYADVEDEGAYPLACIQEATDYDGEEVFHLIPDCWVP